MYNVYNVYNTIHGMYTYKLILRLEMHKFATQDVKHKCCKRKL